MEIQVRRSIPVAALCVAFFLGGAAYAAPSALAEACAKDVKSVCANVKPGRGALKACMESHYKELSADCQVAIVREAAVGRACKSDIKQFCGKAKSGKGAASCLKDHSADISTGCNEALSKARAGDK